MSTADHLDWLFDDESGPSNVPDNMASWAALIDDYEAGS